MQGIDDAKRRVSKMASWGCPHEVNGKCTKFDDLACDPGMKGCVLAGRYFFFASDEKNLRRRSKRDAAGAEDAPATPDAPSPSSVRRSRS